MVFKDIRGQDRPLHILRESLRQAHLGGAYLFTGPQGIGKKLTAKALAKAVNCEESVLDACGRCASCIKIENQRHPDVHILENEESEIKIEDIRQLQREICLRPYEGRTKVFVINNAHTLTMEAAGALLKTLEEPPANSLIILISDKPTLLFKTIISRCKILKFSALERKSLQDICKKEYGVESDLAHFLSFFCEGRLGLALRLKDQNMLQKKNMIIDDFLLSRRHSLSGMALDDKPLLRSQLNIIAAWFRDVYLLKIGLACEELINLDRKPDLLKDANRFTFMELNEIFGSISESISYLERNINVKLLMYNLKEQICRG